MILVVGATGVLGRKVLRLLLAEGHRVRAMTRNLTNAADLESQGAEVCVADLIDHSSIARACQGVSGVLAAAHGFLARGRYSSRAVDDEGHRALIDVARSAGVQRLVYVSGMGAAPDHPVDFFRTKYAIERYVEASGIDHVILRPSAFMELHAHTFNGARILHTGKTTLLGSGRKLRNFVAAADVAWFAKTALTAPHVQRRLIHVGGIGNYSNEDVARMYARASDIDVRIRHLPASAAGALALVATPLHPGIARVLRLGSLPDDAFNETFDGRELEAEFPIKLTTLEAFVDEQVRRWRASGQTASAHEMA